MKQFLLAVLSVVFDFISFCCICGPVLLSALFISNMGG